MCRRAAAVVPLAALAVLISGCGTLINQAEPGTCFNWKGDTTPYRPYGGAQNSAKAAVGLAGYAVGLKTEGVREGYDPFAAAAVSATFLVIDLPLSLVADTILLPSDVRNTLLGRGKLPEGGSPLLRSPMSDDGWTPRQHSDQPNEPAKGNALAAFANNRFSNWGGSMWRIESVKPLAAESDDTSVWQRSYEPFEAYAYPSPPTSQRGPSE